MIHNPCLLLLLQLLLRIEAAKRGKEKERLTWSCYLTMVMEGWLTNVTFFPSTSVFRSLHLCSCFSLFVLFFFFVSLVPPVSLCSCSSWSLSVLSMFVHFSSVFFCIMCLWFSPPLWLLSVRPDFSGYVFGWLDQQPTVRGS
ncbi:hypothetical protein Peur_058198 [Populus x canadensis]